MADPTPRHRWQWMLVAAAAGLVLFLALPLEAGPRSVVAILGFAMVLWVSEALPLGVTALASSLLLVVLLGTPSSDVFSAYFDPVVVLLLGGFMLGVALHKQGLDALLASVTLRHVGRRPAVVLLAVMALTAVFSMWISNTATTAIMLPIAVSLVGGSALPGRGRAYVLGVAAAANIGGIATPIGTTANPIALRFLAEAGEPVTFLGWMLRAAPLAVVLVFAAWAIILRIHPVGTDPVAAPVRPATLDRNHVTLMAIFTAAVVLWLTGTWHGIGPEVIALGAGLLLFVAGLLGAEDIPKVGWDVLMLIGGSIALGQAVQSTGLDALVADRFTVFGDHGPLAAFLAVATVGVLLTLVTSNTAAAVILIPLALQWAPQWHVGLVALVLTAAIAVSFDFLVPMGTPPNAMARATGLVDVRGMLRSGVLVTLLAIPLLVVAARWFW